MAQLSLPLTGNELAFAVLTFIWALFMFRALWKMTLGRLK